MDKPEDSIVPLAAVLTTAQLYGVNAPLDQLAFEWDGHVLYRAANPGYQHFFYRDSSLGARLLGDSKLRRANIAYGAICQGQKYDADSGEEPGKIPHEKHHQLPDTVMPNGKRTTYNACDTTALFLSDIASLSLFGNHEILDTYRSNIEAGIAYIKSHLKDNLFIEDPSLSGGDRFGLRVTYWKDSVLNDPHRIEPVYPVVYTQVHFQNAEALLDMGNALSDPGLVQTALDMYEAGFEKLWAGDHFVTAIDGLGAIDPPSCDSLLTLLHIPTDMLPQGYGQAIEGYMTVLESKAGYMSGIKVGTNEDEYHTRYLWTHMQGLLHMAAVRHQLAHAQEVTSRVVDFIPIHDGIFPELLDPLADYQPAGNELQFWTAAMHWYFIRLRKPFAVAT